ncbi:membrane bound O-acyl transferase, MBOAT [Rhodopseudomonas palustris BisB5]|uniref:Probable alginate O-acetylase AlgI n=1 Tax=Rhodopseudomonas palustris (strain BisB5) TaxID=316057 RepID=Q13DY5_RHOPS|nr:membrane bound O-acyl transferase, MBOAT [Rhodopseudomonas palustris BisB5]
MLFYEPLFLTCFPFLLVLYFAAGDARSKRWILLTGSGLFYLWGEPLFVPVVVVSALVDHLLALRITRTPNAATRRALLTLGVVQNLAILVIYKYTSFAIESLNLLLAAGRLGALPLWQIALPIGVSFVAFEKITYLVDSYRGVSKPARRFSDYCLFVFFFPKLLAGPILKYHEIDGQIAAPRGFAWNDFGYGLLRFSRGIFKKLMIADPLGGYADQVFGADPAGLSAATAWFGVACFTLQIYFDFSGYSDMAIGIARMLGFSLRENFNLPYIARSITDFWRRWHISLTTWIRDYLYIPLGGNRVSDLVTTRNLWICFLLSGLWHGASWNFVLWGAYNGLFLTLDRLFLERALKRSGAVVATLLTLLIVMIGWVIFRSPSAAHLGSFFAALAGLGQSTTTLTPAASVIWTAALGAALSLIPALPGFAALRAAWQGGAVLRLAGNIGLGLLGIVAIARAVAIPFQPFIYFRF